MSEAKDRREATAEVKYEKFKHFGSEVYKEYENVYKQLSSKVNESHLKPFAEILMEKENTVLKGQDKLVESVRQNLEKQLQQVLHNIWETNTVSEALIAVEMCKEKFQLYEGQKWNLDAKTPWELTRPIRMRFKENRLRYLQAQLTLQNKELEEVLQENKSMRQHLLNIKHQRSFLIKNIDDFRKKIESAKTRITEIQLKMLTDNDNNVETVN